MKKLLVISLGFLVAVSVSSCTSSDANKENAQEAAAADENMPLENGGDFSKDAAAADGGNPADAQASMGLDDVPLDGNVDAAKNSAAPDSAGSLDLGDPDNEFPADVAKSQKEGLPPTDDKVFAEAAPGKDAAAPPPDVSQSTKDESAPPPIENMQSSNEVTPSPVEAAPAPEVAASAPAASALPYEKIKTEPFEKNGVLLNRVYLARANDTAKSISQKIYGSPDQAKSLKAWNPSLKSRRPRVGDKIYYNSPKEPQDNTKMLVFYEEMGVEPQRYTTQAGDDIRKVSTKLLGHKDSWKEIYATNANLENKMGKVSEGVELRYWPSMNEAQQQLAQNSFPPAAAAPPQQQPGLPAEPINNLPPDAPQPIAANAPPGANAAAQAQQPNAPPAVAAAAVQPPPEPPPQAPPPPPPIEKPTKKPASPAQALDASSDPDQTMMMLAGGLLVVAAAAAFVVIRRQRAKRIDLSQQTQA